MLSFVYRFALNEVGRRSDIKFIVKFALLIRIYTIICVDVFKLGVCNFKLLVLRILAFSDLLCRLQIIGIFDEEGFRRKIRLSELLMYQKLH